MVSRDSVKRKFKCIFCGALFRNKQSLSKHSNAKHPGECAEVSGRMVEIVQGNRNLSELLRRAAAVVEQGNSEDLPPEFVEELKTKEIRTQLALHILAFNKIASVLQASTFVSRLNSILVEKFKTEEVEKLSVGDVMKLKEMIDRSVTGDVEFLQSLSIAGRGELLVSKLVDAMAELKNTVRSTVQDSEIPADPAEREEIRKAASRILPFRETA